MNCELCFNVDFNASVLNICIVFNRSFNWKCPFFSHTSLTLRWCFPLSLTLCLTIDHCATLPTPADLTPLCSLPPPRSPFPELHLLNFSFIVSLGHAVFPPIVICFCILVLLPPFLLPSLHRFLFFLPQRLSMLRGLASSSASASFFASFAFILLVLCECAVLCAPPVVVFYKVNLWFVEVNNLYAS